LTVALTQGSPTTITDWLPFLTELSRRLETELGEKAHDLTEVKKVIHSVGNALKSLEVPPLKIPPPTIDDPRARGTPNRGFRSFLAN